MGDMRTVTVNVGHTSYPVFVGAGARRELAAVVPAPVRRVAVVTQDSVPAGLIPSFAGLDVSLHLIGEGEDHKSMASVETLCRAFSRAGLTRNDLVVGVGGGMVTDVAGFAAASYHRGTRVMHVATTLLGMVDAAIGGKTGVNIPEGKNLIGAFWQPSAVACDLDALGTLPEREHRCGSGELAKYHFIAREDLASLDLSGRIARAVEIKARIVEADERGAGSAHSSTTATPSGMPSSRSRRTPSRTARPSRSACCSPLISRCAWDASGRSGSHSITRSCEARTGSTCGCPRPYRSGHWSRRWAGTRRRCRP